MIFDKDRDEVYTYFKAMEEFPALLNLKRGADCKKQYRWSRYNPNEK
jgi:hypothetical protein